MPRPCTICSHLERANIDRRLCFQVVNVAQLAREYGVKPDAMHAHRRNHLPEFLPAFQAQAGALTLTQLQAEAQRLYLVTLDALAMAEAGVLERVKITDPDTGEETYEHRPVVSITGVARMIREARAGLGQLAALAGDRGDDEGRPSTGADAELGAAIRTQLARVVARQSVAALRVGEEPIGEDEALDLTSPRTLTHPDVEGEDPPGGSERAAGGAAWGVGKPLDTDAPTETPDPSAENMDVPSLNPEQLRIAAASIGITPESFLASIRQARPQLVRHPEWEGNPAASEEERKAEGFGSIPVKDNRITEDTRITPVQ